MKATPPTPGPWGLRWKFGLSKVVLVGDRGMLTEARIREEVAAGLDWISALRRPFANWCESGAVQMSLFDHTDLVEIHSVYPGERLMVCRNPLLGIHGAQARRVGARHRAALDPIGRHPTEKRPLPAARFPL